MRTVLKIVLAIIIFLFNATADAQNPVITNVTVINDQGHVRISWTYTGFEKLQIFRDNSSTGSLLPIITNELSVKTFIDVTAQAQQNPRLYKLQGEFTSSISSDVVTTFHLTFDYDSCLQQVSLNWKDLKMVNNLHSEWTPSLFLINIIENGSLTKKTVSASTLEHTMDIQNNANYSISIETVWKDTTSYSNPIILNTNMPRSPDFINSLSASAAGSDTELRFEIAPNSELSNYKLLKSDSQNGNFDTLETITTSNFEIVVTDYDSEPDSKISYYKLIAINECGNEKTNSDIINNIVLKVENEESINTLSWNLFKEYKMAPVNYDIYRVANNTEAELIRSFQNFNTISDNIGNLQSEQFSGRFCYFIRAREESLSSENYSQSNTACAYLNPKVYIPEAFTPNDDGTNDLFLPVLTFLPSAYKLRIYNRWGNIVFETSDPSKPWNGEGSNGKKVPAGAYIYYLKINPPENQSIEKRGSITVFYP